MIERLLMVAVLAVLAIGVYQVLRWRQLKQVNQSAVTDPLLGTLRPDTPAIIYFTTPGCVPCRTQQQPALQQLADELGDGVQIVKIDATEEPATADRWGVFSAPTTFVVNPKKQVHSVNYGFADSQRLKQQLQQATGSL
jgi:thiol-disulfide isomerase/thioredoxin